MSYNKITNKYEGYIYCITNLINNRKYIGLTTRTIQRRWRQHVNISHQKAVNDCTIIDIAIYKYHEENFKVEQLEFVEKDTLQELKEALAVKEKEYIKEYHTLCKDEGYNVDEGGSTGSINYSPTDVYDMNGNLINQFSSRMECSDYYNVGIVTILNICSGKTGNYQCKYVFRNKGDAFDLYNIKNHAYYRDVYQFDLNGNLLNQYFSYGEIPLSCSCYIHEVINNPYKTAGGYWWSSINKFNYLGNPTFVPVDLYDLNGNLLKTFDNKNMCAKYLGVSISTIDDCCKGRSHTAKKYVIRIKGEPFDKYPLENKKHPMTRRVNMYSLDGKYIQTFESMSEAANYVGVKGLSRISSCCNHKKQTKTAYNYLWFFENDISQPDKTKIA